MRDVDEPGTLLVAGRLRATRRMLVVPTLGVVLWGAGSNAGAGFLVLLAGGLVASVPWAWATARKASRSVRVRRELPSRAESGQAIEATLRITARGVAAVVVRDELLGAVGVVDDTQRGGRLRAEVQLARGIATTGRVEVEVTDPFGLFRTVAAGQVPSPVEVLPGLLPVEPPRPGIAARNEADDRPRRRGSGSEADGTREYRHGDSPRAVHWRSSARQQSLVVRQFVGDAAGRLRVTVQPGPWSAAALDRACVLGGSLADAAHRGGVDVQLCVDGVARGWDATGRRALAALTPNLCSDEGRGTTPGGGPSRAAALVRDHELEVVLRPRGDHFEVLEGGGVTAVAQDADLAACLRQVARRVAGGGRS